MTSLLILAVLLLALWVWATWQRQGAASFMSEWSYVPLVGAVTCLVMSIGLWLR
jgi:hypothetical protein